MRFAALTIIVYAILLSACTKDTTAANHRLPTFTFKTDLGYTFANDTVGSQDTLKVGVVIDRTDDALRAFEMKVAYDGSLAQTMKDSVGVGTDHFTRDEHLIMRNLAGKEKWTFLVLLANGNTVTRSLTFVVQ